MMFKTIFTIQFREDMPREVCHEYWRTTHKELVLKCDGVVKYVQNLKVRELPSEDDSAASGQWDGVVELFFADEAAFSQALESAEWADVMRDCYNFLGVNKIEAGIVEEEHIL